VAAIWKNPLAARRQALSKRKETTVLEDVRCKFGEIRGAAVLSRKVPWQGCQSPPGLK